MSDLPDEFSKEWIKDWMKNNPNPVCDKCKGKPDTAYFIGKGAIGPGIILICNSCRKACERRIKMIGTVFL